ncbi:MAG: hypothetical protein U5N26_05080 [Candidatus Marinimicrobia bacterium]|nr:hypothetical protein [Candidatus Neomarinimicrobiota bacterium]
MTIATILFSSLLLVLLLGKGSPEGAAGAIIIGAVRSAARPRSPGTTSRT